MGLNAQYTTHRHRGCAEQSHDGYFPAVPTRQSNRKPELLAPAGGPNAGYAALEYGADAIYLGLRSFSARADAENFSLDELSDITGYAHSLTPRRRVFVTFNTLVFDRELDELIDSLAAVADIGADAVVVQDLGVARIVRRSFPSIRLHASTQLAIHNTAGVHTARDLGFHRVTLARELTLAEIRAIVTHAGIEIETFVHGALCYSYSGLCLYSSLLRGRSGNRGRCQYPCRDSFTAVDERTGESFPFSMKDLALPDAVPDLAEAGVASLKIEGRKKNALYVAAVTRLYRNVLDGNVSKAALDRLQRDAQTTFSRPWTSLFVRNPRNRVTVDTRTVGHRGTPVGRVETIAGGRGATHRVRFTTSRDLQLHDGLQVDLAQASEPFGFAVEALYRLPSGGGRACYTVSACAGERVEVPLPPGHPAFPRGATIYCASSQAVKQSHPFHRPKAGAHRVRHRLDTIITVEPGRIGVRCSVGGPDGALVTVEAEAAGCFSAARNPDATERAARDAFSKLGDTPFVAGSCTVTNPDRLFVPASSLNALRRDAAVRLATLLDQAHARHRRKLHRSYSTARSAQQEPDDRLRWSLRVAHGTYLSSLLDSELDEVDDVVVDMDTDDEDGLVRDIEALGGRLGRERIRLALPAITRAPETRHVADCMRRLCEAGWRRWEARNVSAWTLLREAGCVGTDLTCDWPLYVVNGSAAALILDMQATGFLLPPDVDPPTTTELVRRFPGHAIAMLYGDPPLFISESCALASLRGGCPGSGHCRNPRTVLSSSRGEKLIVVQRGCRSYVIGERPICSVQSLQRLGAAGVTRVRVDFAFRSYTPRQVADVWRALRAGETPPVISTP